jgi:hypothetical protein
MNKGLLKRIGVASALGLALASRAPSLDVKFYSGVELNFQAGNNASLPESARLVPIHPDDTYANEKNNGPIKNVLTGITMEGVRAKFGVEARENQFGAKAGVGFGFDSYSFSKENSWGFAERNYTNHPGTSERGYGAALTYYDFSESGSIGVFVSPFLNLSYHFPSGKEGNKVYAFVEYAPEFHSFSTSIETGYDRWNKLEKLDDVRVSADFMTNLIKVGAGFDWDYDLGMMPELYLGFSTAKTSDKDKINVSGKNFCIGVGTKIDLDKLVKKK